MRHCDPNTLLSCAPSVPSCNTEHIVSFNAVAIEHYKAITIMAKKKKISKEERINLVSKVQSKLSEPGPRRQFLELEDYNDVKRFGDRLNKTADHAGAGCSKLVDRGTLFLHVIEQEEGAVTKGACQQQHLTYCHFFKMWQKDSLMVHIVYYDDGVLWVLPPGRHS
jgi:hypothetical protein